MTDERTASDPVDAPGGPPEPIDPEAAQDADVSRLSYETARDELVSIVARLEAGQIPLEDSMRLWRRGEALAARCSQWLDGAEAELAQAAPADPQSPTAAGPAG